MKSPFAMVSARAKVIATSAGMRTSEAPLSSWRNPRRPSMGFAPKIRFAPDSPLEGAVTSEPVSEAQNSLLAGKIQGISPIRGLAAPWKQRKRARNQFLMDQFPTHPNREFFAALQGIKSGDQGSFRRDQGIPLSSAILAFAHGDTSDRPDRFRKTLPGRRTGTPPDTGVIPAGTPEPRVAGGTEGSNPSTRESVAN